MQSLAKRSSTVGVPKSIVELFGKRKNRTKREGFAIYAKPCQEVECSRAPEKYRRTFWEEEKPNEKGRLCDLCKALPRGRVLTTLRFFYLFGAGRRLALCSCLAKKSTQALFLVGASKGGGSTGGISVCLPSAFSPSIGAFGSRVLSNCISPNVSKAKKPPKNKIKRQKAKKQRRF